jgi:hypothetical protein
MPQPWSDDAIRHLLDANTCPRCGVDALHDRRCLNCGADLRGDIADRLWTASNAAVAALRTRQEVLDSVPVVPVEAVAPVVAPAAAAASVAAPLIVAAPDAVPQPERASATVQSVLAVAGAGLFAVAAIVFTFFNPDLTDHALRSGIVGFVTLVFLGGAWLLARRGLQFSAEAVAALGMVFVALDIYAFSELAPEGVSGWVFTAIGTLVSGVVMILVATTARIRSWLLISLAGLAWVPAMVGYAGGDAGFGVWPPVLGHLAAGFAVLALLQVVRIIAPRFDGKLTADRVALTVLQLLFVFAVVVRLPFTDAPTTTQHWLAIAGVLAALAVLSALATRHLIGPFWSFVSGGLAVAAVSVLPFALDLERPDWYLALVPAAAAVVLIALGALPTPKTVVRGLFTAGVLTIAGVATVTTVFFGLMLVLFTLISSLRTNYVAADLLNTDGGIATVLGLTAAAIGVGGYGMLVARRAGAATIGTRVASSAAVSLLMLAALTLASWSAWLPITQVALALGIALATSLLILFVPIVRSASLAVRVPAVIGAHAALVLGAQLSWTDSSLTVVAGIAAVAVLIAVAHTVPADARPVHVGVGYAYALLIFARWLDLTDVFSTIALLCLTTTLGAVGAIVATLVRRVRPGAWYAVLIVTAVPFLIGIGTVLVERSGWTALSTGVTFLLALTLLLTRRPGLNIVVRTIAAALLVPALAVVVVSLAAEFLKTSGSPVALPVIAVIVAGVLPSTGLIRSGLVRHGLADREAAVARIAIEASALVTGAIAVILALVRAASGLDTTFLVLVIIGIGAAAAAIWGKRRYGWWVAFAAFTGALWCIWALNDVQVVEPYLLPPAIALAIIGIIVTARGGRGVPLYATGLAVATIPVLGLLAFTGNGSDTVPWRSAGLVAGAWLLLLVGTLLGRGKREWARRLASLRVSTLAVAIAAGAAGAVQGVRFSVDADHLSNERIGVLFISLAFGVAGALAAAAAGRAMIDLAEPGSRLATTRWLYAPATVYIALSVWFIRPGHFDWPVIWSMWGLTIAYLVFMLVVVLVARRGRTTLPPVWLIFAVAFITAVVGWSARDLRVEWFSLPLGLFLLGAGILAMGQRPSAAEPGVATGNSWPIGFVRSWPLLGPGIIVTFLASVLSTGTDPQTWRAIMVIAIALVSILIGSQLKLAAPFFLGIIVLPIENIVVFAVQIGRGIESVPWWITLAIVGAVLLIIAVTYERRSGADNSVAARLRDLK